MKTGKINEEVALRFNEWQDNAGKKPQYIALDVNELGNIVDFLADDTYTTSERAQEIGTDFLFLVCAYANNCQIEEIENVIKIDNYDPKAVKFFNKVKPMIDIGFINFKNSQDKGEKLTMQRMIKQGVIVSLEQMEEFAETNKLYLQQYDIERANNDATNGNINNWSRYLQKISAEHWKKGEVVIPYKRVKVTTNQSTSTDGNPNF